jgi:hypothetical protein
LLLRQHTAEARGFGSEIKLPILAKLMLAERFIPRLFDQIAYSAAANPKGLCDGLAAIEKDREKGAASGAKKAGADTKPGSATELPAEGGESALVTEWLSSPQILKWAQIKPSLAAVDLRPYLFVTKDRKDYFGAASALGHLSTVVEKLFGPKLIVQNMDSDLKKLAPPEAAQVFEALRARIMSDDALTTAPPGVDGMAVLVKAQPTLQSSLIDFLEGLPRARCGAWPTSGWKTVLIDPLLAVRFDGLVERWASSSDASTALRSAAAAIRRVGSRGTA